MLESDTDTETEVAHVAYVIGHHFPFIGGIAVISGDVDARAIDPWIDVHTDFRRHIESPSVVVVLKCVERGF